MKSNAVSFRRAAGLVAGSLLIASAGFTAEAPKDTDALPKFAENYIRIGGNLPSLSGPGASSSFQNRTQLVKKGTAGIEEFNYTVDLDKVTNLKVDAKVMPGVEDYLSQFKLSREKLGSVEAGYKRARTFYDGAGGFFPINNAWISLYPRALYVDRGQFFFNGTLALEKAPVVTLNYRNDTRMGRKDSTIWGDTDLTGIPIYRPSVLNLVSSNRKIVPAYLDLHERQETLELAIANQAGATSWRFAVLGNRIGNLNRRSVDRYPGELSPRPALPSNPNPPIQVSPYQVANQNKGFDQLGVDEDGLTWTGKVITKLSDNAKLSVSAAYRHAAIDTAGSRLITANILTDAGLTSTVGGYTPGGRSPYSQSGTGHLTQDVLTGVVGLDYNPTKHLELAAALKAEDYKSEGTYNATYVLNMVNLTTGVITPQSLTAPNSSKITEQPLIPEISARYTGISNVALWLTWDLRTAPGDDKTSYVGLTTSSTAMVLSSASGANDHVKEKHSNLKVGGNWTPSSMLMVRAEVFTKDHENDFRGQGASLGSYYVLDYNVYGFRTTATVKPSAQIAFSTRYLVQWGKADISEDGYLHGNSNDSRRYQLSETIDWNPTKQAYVQANVAIFWDTVGTVYPRAGGTANDVLHNADNNFWNGSIVTAYVLDKNTDAQIQVTYYKSNNWNPALASSTTPYGQGGREFTASAGLKHKFSDRLVGSAKVGYLDNRSETTGGFANYKGPIGYLTFDYRL